MYNKLFNRHANAFSKRDKHVFKFASSRAFM